MAKRKRRKARKNPPASSYVGYALVGAGLYLLYRKSRGLGAPPEFVTGVRKGPLDRFLDWLTGEDREPQVSRSREPLVYTTTLEKSTPTPQPPVPRSEFDYASGYAPWNRPTEVTAERTPAVEVIAERQSIIFPPYAALNAEQRGLKYGIKPSGPPDAARAAIERVVGPMTEPAPMTPGSPTNVVGWWRNYTPARETHPPVGAFGIDGKPTRGAALPGGADPSAIRVESLVKSGAASAAGVVDETHMPISESRVAPMPPSKLDMARVKSDLIASANIVAGGYLKEAKKSGAFSDRFYSAIQARKDSWTENAGGVWGAAKKLARGVLPKEEISQTGISSAYYAHAAKVGDPYGRENLKNYQNAYVKVAELEGLAKKGASVEGRLMAAKLVLDSYDKQAGKSQQDTLDTGMLKVVHDTDYANKKALAAGMSPAEGKRVMQDLELQQKVDRVRLAEKQAGYGEGRGRESVPAMSARVGAREAAEQIAAAKQERYDPDVAADLIRQVAGDKAKGYKPLPGESFEDAAKREVRTGALADQNPQMKAEAEKRVRAMQTDSGAVRAEAKAGESARRATVANTAEFDRALAEDARARAAASSLATVTFTRQGGGTTGPPPQQGKPTPAQSDPYGDTSSTGRKNPPSATAAVEAVAIKQSVTPSGPSAERLARQARNAADAAETD